MCIRDRAEGFPTVYIMGDCRWEACIRDTVERFNPDYIVVTSGGAIFPEFSKTDGPIIPDETEVMPILDCLLYTSQRFYSHHQIHRNYIMNIQEAKQIRCL